MDDRSVILRSTVRAGAFLVAALGILVVGSLWIAGSLFWEADQTTYEVLMKSSAGVRRGDRTRVSGVEAGRVEAVELRPGEEWPVIFRVALGARVRVTEAASAHFSADGLLGTPYLEIDPGPADAPPLPAGAPIVGSDAPSAAEALSGLGALSDRATLLLEETTVLVGDLTQRTGPLLERLERLLSDENLAAAGDSLAALHDTLEDAGPRLSALLARLDALAVELDEGVAGLPDLLAEVQALATDLRAALGPDGARLADLLETAESTLGSAGGGVRAVEMNRGQLEATLRDLRDVTANLKAFSETVRERPSRLVWRSRARDRKPGEGVAP